MLVLPTPDCRLLRGLDVSRALPSILVALIHHETFYVSSHNFSIRTQGPSSILGPAHSSDHPELLVRQSQGRDQPASLMFVCGFQHPCSWPVCMAPSLASFLALSWCCRLRATPASARPACDELLTFLKLQVQEGKGPRRVSESDGIVRRMADFKAGIKSFHAFRIYQFGMRSLKLLVIEFDTFDCSIIFQGL